MVGGSSCMGAHLSSHRAPFLTKSAQFTSHTSATCSVSGDVIRNGARNSHGCAQFAWLRAVCIPRAVRSMMAPAYIAASTSLLLRLLHRFSPVTVFSPVIRLPTSGASSSPVVRLPHSRRGSHLWCGFRTRAAASAPPFGYVTCTGIGSRSG